MNFSGTFARSWRRRLAMAAVVGIGLVSLESHRLRVFGVDALLRARSAFFGVPVGARSGVALVFLEVASWEGWRPWAELIRTLGEARASAVVLDVVLSKDQWLDPRAVAGLSNSVVKAWAESGTRVVFAGRGLIGPEDLGSRSVEVLPADGIKDLVESLAPKDAAAIGLSNLDRHEADGVVRLYRPETNFVHDALAVTVYRLVTGRRVTPDGWWIHYYGPPGTLPALQITRVDPGTGSLTWDLPDPASHLEKRVVFVGQSPKARDTGDSADRHRTPLSPGREATMSGVEIHATLFQNLARGDAIREFRRVWEWLGVFLLGWVSARVFPRRPPIAAALVAVGAAGLVVAVSLVVFVAANIAIPWAAIVGPTLLAGVATSFLPVKSAFLAYRRSDGLPVAQTLGRELDRRGVEVFLDVDQDLSGGLDDVLEGEIARHGNYLLVITPGVVREWRGNGDWIARELRCAERRRKRILPVYVDDVGNLVKQEYHQAGVALPEGLKGAIETDMRAAYQSELASESADRIARKLRWSLRGSPRAARPARQASDRASASTPDRPGGGSRAT